jgi:hypothetical protein
VSLASITFGFLILVCYALFMESTFICRIYLSSEGIKWSNIAFGSILDISSVPIKQLIFFPVGAKSKKKNIHIRNHQSLSQVFHFTFLFAPYFCDSKNLALL